MNIKTAFRYQNFLTSLKDDAEYTLSKVKVKQTETHQKSLANLDAVDEIIETENLDLAAGITAESCLSLIFDIFEEKAILDKAISEAKRGCSFDFDAELNTNKLRRELIHRFNNYYTNAKNTERMTRGQDYKFNAEGNQTPYSYPVKTVSELTYDKTALVQKVKALSADADMVSDKADEFLLETMVDFEPKFNIHDTFENIISNYKKSPVITEIKLG